MRYLIAYDIRNKKRLTKVHRELVNWAIPLQKSLFLFLDPQGKKQELEEILIKLINRKEDDLRIYPIYKKSLQWRKGQIGLFDDFILGTFDLKQF